MGNVLKEILINITKNLAEQASRRFSLIKLNFNFVTHVEIQLLLSCIISGTIFYHEKKVCRYSRFSAYL